MDLLLTTLLIVIIFLLMSAIWLLREIYNMIQEIRGQLFLHPNRNTNIFVEGQNTDTSGTSRKNSTEIFRNETQVPPTKDYASGENKEDEKVKEEIGQSMGKTMKEIGHINLVVVGQTGVGKSTLVKEMFPEQLGKKVESGTADPVTQDINEYKIDDVPLSIFESPGFELSNTNIQKNVTNFIKNRNDNVDPNQHIHLLWYCLNVNSKTIEQTEKEFINHLSTIMPVVVVLTQCYTPDEDYCQLIKKEFPNVKNVVEVVARKYDHNTKETIPASGMKSLCDVSINLLPETQAKAFIAAQKVDLKAKKTKCRSIIVASASGASAAGASPIPFTDAAIIAPIQGNMVSGMSSIFGLNLSTKNIAAILGVVTGTSVVGRLFVTNLLKFIPGVGTVVGGVINASTAGAVTTAFGEVYLAVLCELWEENHGDQIDFDTMLKKFKVKYSNKDKQK